MIIDHLQPDMPQTRPVVRAWPLIAVLTIVFMGPLVAPLFQATGVPWVADSGALARGLLSQYVCPTPSKSYVLLGFPMAVCARCWGATIGLWMAWFLFRARRAGRTARRLEAYLALAWPLQLSLAACALLLWAVEITLWPGAPLPALLLNGAHGGFWAALLAGASLGKIGRGVAT